MGRVLVIGEAASVRPFALGGAVVAAAETDGEVRQAWESRPQGVALLILTTRAAVALCGLPRPPGILEAVMQP